MARYWLNLSVRFAGLAPNPNIRRTRRPPQSDQCRRLQRSRKRHSSSPRARDRISGSALGAPARASLQRSVAPTSSSSPRRSAQQRSSGSPSPGGQSPRRTRTPPELRERGVARPPDGSSNRRAWRQRPRTPAIGSSACPSTHYRGDVPPVVQASAWSSLEERARWASAC